MLLIVSKSIAQEETKAPKQEVSNYNYHEAFTPVFYTKNGNSIRSASGAPGAQYWQNRVDYSIKANLNPEKNEVLGSEIITYTNNSPDKLNFLWLHLDQNLFKSDSRGKAVIPLEGSRNGDKGQNFNGGCTIKSISVVSESNVKSISQEVPFEITDTRMQVFLPKEIASNGGKVKLKIDFNFVAPIYGSDRMGILETKNGKIFNIAQWYPRLCVYDDVMGWNTLPYLGAGEFYLEYGDFEVAITAPSDVFVVCGGELLNPTEVYSPEHLKRWDLAKNSDKTIVIRSEDEVFNKKNAFASKKSLTWKFKLNNARDVAWSASSAFIIDAARINLPSGKKSISISAYPIESMGSKAWSRATEYNKGAIEHYSSKWFEYPYPVAVNVAGNQGGMEYPGIVFCNWKSEGQRLWGVSDHEFGHCWFPMIVGSNERVHAWMDEGFNMFINTLSTKAFNKGEYYEKPEDAHIASQVLTHPFLEPIMTVPDGMKEDHLGYLAYDKPALGLKILREQILGETRFDRAFKTYIERWAFKHPTPDDFFRTIENVAGEDLKWFWRAWFVNNWKLDQSIVSVKYIKNDPKLGAIITVANMEKMAMPMDIEIKTKSGQIINHRLPVEIWQRNVVWDFKPILSEAIDTITIDPNHVYPDSNEGNNVWKATTGTLVQDVILDPYIGNFSSKQTPIEVSLSDENSKLIAVFTDQPPLELEYLGNNKFVFVQVGLEIQFNEAKSEFTLKINGDQFLFTRK